MKWMLWSSSKPEHFKMGSLGAYLASACVYVVDPPLDQLRDESIPEAAARSPLCPSLPRFKSRDPPVT